MTRFAEPEEGMEAYIPAGPDAASRNRRIWDEAVRRLEEGDADD